MGAINEFLHQLAKQAGYELEFQRVGPKTGNTAGERQTGDSDPSLSFEVFSKMAIPSRALAFRDEHIDDAVKRFPELAGAAQALALAKHLSEADYDPGPARLFLAKIHAQLVERLSTGDIIKPPAAKPPDRAAKTFGRPRATAMCPKRPFGDSRTGH